MDGPDLNPKVELTQIRILEIVGLLCGKLI